MLKLLKKLIIIPLILVGIVLITLFFGLIFNPKIMLYSPINRFGFATRPELNYKYNTDCNGYFYYDDNKEEIILHIQFVKGPETVGLGQWFTIYFVQENGTIMSIHYFAEGKYVIPTEIRIKEDKEVYDKVHHIEVHNDKEYELQPGVYHSETFYLYKGNSEPFKA